MSYYKCPSYDNTILNMPTISDTVSGPIANFTTSLALPLVALKAYIQAQGGGGTPSAPVAITGVSEVNVTRAGKNLLAKPFIYNDNDDLDSLSECFFIKAGSYVASFDGMSNAINWRFIVRLKDANGNNLNTTDYVTFNSSMSWSATRKAWINNANTTAKNCIFTLNQDCYIRILFGIGNTSSSSIASNAKLELGSTRTDYVPYNADTFTLSLGQTCYGGYIDKESGKLYATYKRVLLSDLSWSKYASTPPIFYARVDDKENTNDNYVIAEGFESIHDTTTNVGGAASKLTSNCTIIASKGSTNPNIYLRYDEITSAADLPQALENLYCVYQLAIPVEVGSITLPDIKALVGENNIFADSGNISLQYQQTIQEYISQ